MEFSQLGWNIMTLGFFGTILTTLMTAWGLHYQAKSIAEHRSGESVSLLQYLYAVAGSVATVIYGISIMKFVLICNGLILFFTRLPVVASLKRHKGASNTDRLLGALLFVALAAMAVLNQKDGFYVMFQLGGIFFTVAQPWEILHNRSSGVVELRLIIVAFFHSVFWFSYSIGISNHVIMLTSICGLLTHLTTVGLWVRYRNSKTA